MIEISYTTMTIFLFGFVVVAVAGIVEALNAADWKRTARDCWLNACAFCAREQFDAPDDPELREIVDKIESLRRKYGKGEG